MKKKLYILGLGLAFFTGGLVLGGSFLNANPPAPGGSFENPAVSMYYFNERINEIMQIINAQGAGGQINTEAVVNEVLADITNFFGAGMTFTPVHVNAGQIILAGEGTEIIRRSGSATAHVPGQDGIVNATTGHDIFHDATIPANNLLIVPREDGRGVRATADSWFIIRGSFSIVGQ
ncbi:MAG: hypothetical protein FWE34_01380 [Defluviitaleaceae bacterium]|nr:hypothetical protein [Defluviitaleaceae bacterium]